MPTIIETEFPFEQIDPVAEQESWRKEVNRPLYHIHKWWANRLGSVFRAITLGVCSSNGRGIWEQFYESHQFSGKIILDPFMGSGTTIGEAVKLGCRAIGCDINPISSFLVRQALTQVSREDLQSGFDRIADRAKASIQHYYKTTPAGVGTCDILYTFWVKTATLPNGNLVPLFSSYVFSRNAYPKKKPTARILCPECGEVLSGRFDAIRVKCTSCSASFNPQIGTTEGQHVIDPATGKKHKIKALIHAAGEPPKHKMYAIMALSDSGEKLYLKPSSKDQDLYKEACDELRRRMDALPLPDTKLEPGHNTDQAIGYGYQNWRDFYNERQLLCLGILIDAILKEPTGAVREHLLCLFSSTLEFNNLFCSFKGEGTGAVRHIFSHHILKPERMPLENSVWGTSASSGTFSTLFKTRLLRAKRYLQEPFEIKLEANGTRQKSVKVYCNNPIETKPTDDVATFLADQRSTLLLNRDSQSLPLPDGIVDAVVTDPPYFDFVHYSELSDFFFAWLSPVLKDTLGCFGSQSTRNVNEVQDKCSSAFARKLCQVFRECHRVMKPEGVLVFSFHHSRTAGWQAIYDAVVEAGFIVCAAHPVKAEMSVASPKSASRNPINLDALLVCKKADKTAPPDTRWSSLKKRCRRSITTVIERMADAGRKLSEADRFVIAQSQLLVHASKYHSAVVANGKRLSFAEMSARLESTLSQRSLF